MKNLLTNGGAKKRVSKKTQKVRKASKKASKKSGKRKATPYIKFVTKELKQRKAGEDVKKIMKNSGKKWRAMSNAEKAKYK